MSNATSTKTTKTTDAGTEFVGGLIATALQGGPAKTETKTTAWKADAKQNCDTCGKKAELFWDDETESAICDKCASANGQLAIVVGGGLCRCGCGQKVEKSYKQGHDARHVSLLVHAVVAGDMSYQTAVAQLMGADRLIVKLERAYIAANARAAAAKERRIATEQRAANRLAAASKKAAAKKAAKKAAKAEAAKAPVGPIWTDVQVGRWTYPVIDILGQEGDQVEVRYETRKGEKIVATVQADKLTTKQVG